MTEVERAILAQYHKQIKLAKIWRAIARRHLSCHVAKMLEVWQAEDAWMRQAQAKAEHIDMDGETDS